MGGKYVYGGWVGGKHRYEFREIEMFDCFSLLAALIGNHVLTTADLAAFHTKLVPDLETDKVRIKLFD